MATKNIDTYAMYKAKKYAETHNDVEMKIEANRQHRLYECGMGGDPYYAFCLQCLILADKVA